MMTITGTQQNFVMSLVCGGTSPSYSWIVEYTLGVHFASRRSHVFLLRRQFSVMSEEF